MGRRGYFAPRAQYPRPVEEVAVTNIREREVRERTALDLTAPETGPPPAIPAPEDLAHAAAGVAGLALVATILACWATDAAAGLETAVILFAFFGLGTAILQLSRVSIGLGYLVTGLGLGVAISVLTPTVLLEAHRWSLARPVMGLCILVAAVLHVEGLRRHGPALTRGVRLVVTQRSDTASGPSTVPAITGLSVVGVDLAALGALTHRHLDPNLHGLSGSIGPLWIVGLAILVVAFVGAWAHNSRVIALPALLITAVLAGTPAVVYDVARYSWTQKHIGITQLILLRGHLSPHIDIYQSWPGFFAAFAWFCKVSGATHLEAVARWWPLAVNVGTVVVIRYLARRLGLSPQTSWLAAILVMAGNTVGQDYFSPQSMAFLCALIAVATVVRPEGQQRRAPWFEWVTFVGLAAVMAVSHQLTPFVIGGVLVVFAVFRLTVSRLVAIVPLALAGTWATLHWSAVKKYFKVGDVGNVGANLATPSAAQHYHYTTWAHVSLGSEIAAPVFVGLLAVAALLTRRDRLSWALATCAASMGGLLVVVHYGNEDLLRMTLFAVPWLAILAAHGKWGQSAIPRRITRRVVASRMSLVILVPATVAAYVLGDLGADYISAVRSTDLSAVQYFEHTAPRGSILVTFGKAAYLPTDDSPRYPALKYYSFQVDARYSTQEQVRALTNYLIYSSQAILQTKHIHPHFYAIFAEQEVAQARYDGLATPVEFKRVASTLASEPDWRVIYRTRTAVLLQLTVPQHHRRVSRPPNYQPVQLPPPAAARTAPPPSRAVPSPRPTPTTTLPPAACTAADLDIVTTRDPSSYSYAAGQAVRITSRLTDVVTCNFQPVAIEPSGCPTNVTVVDGNGSQVYPAAGQGEVCSSPGGGLLEPGAALMVSIVWDTSSDASGPGGSSQYQGLGAWTWMGPGGPVTNSAASSPFAVSS